MTSATTTRNRRRQDLVVRQRAELAQLRAELVTVAKYALPTHPRGGFGNPLEQRDARRLAERILILPLTGPHT